MSREPRRPAPRPVDPYAVLGVGRRADEPEIKRAYFAMVRLHPPERDAERFREVRTAYEQLRTPEARARTDLFLLQPPTDLPRRRSPTYDLDVHFEDVSALAWSFLMARLAADEEFRAPDFPPEEVGV